MLRLQPRINQRLTVAGGWMKRDSATASDLVHPQKCGQQVQYV